MSLFFGGGGQKAKPQYTGLATQTSTTTIAVALAYGLNRAAPNIVWQGDFASHKQTQKTGKGLSGGGGTTYTYSGSYVLGLGWGPSTGCRRVWKDQSKETSFAALGFTLIPGTIPQDPWGYLTTNHPTEALGYPGLVQMVNPNYDLGQSNALAQHSFEMEWPFLDTAPGGVGDADIALVIEDFLTSQSTGALTGTTMQIDNLLSTVDAPTTGDSTAQTYWTAMGFGFSPLLDSQETASNTLDRWTRLFNCALSWTGYSLKFLPYGSETITANGVTYLPDATLRFEMTDVDFIRGNDEDPVRLRRKAPADTFNSVKLEIRNRSNEYNSEPAEWRDQGLVDQFGLKAQSSVKATEICEPSIGATCAALVGQRTAYLRNEFEANVGPEFMLLQTGDIGTIEDPRWGVLKVMIIDSEEQDDGSFKLVFEEYNGSVGASGGGTSQGVTNNPVDTNVSAGPVNPPIIFEPPSSLAGPTPQVWMAVSGGNGTVADPNWGGCFVWLSSDNVTFQQVGQIDSAARMGVLTTALPAYGGANPDTVNSCLVNLARSAGELTGVTAADAAAAVTLCYVGGEFLSYRDATLTSTYHYTLGGQLYRKLYGTTAGLHAIGTDFARLDENIFKFDLPAEYIGVTLYAKFQSFNIFGEGVQDLASVTAYTYSPTGGGFGTGSGGVPSTPTGVSGSAGGGFAKVIWTANPVNDNVTVYEVWRATGSSQPFGSAARIGTTTGTEYTDTSGTYTQPYTYFVVARNAIGVSGASTGVNLTPTQPTLSITYPYGFAFGPKPPVASKILAVFDTPIAWTIPIGLTDAQGTIVDSDTATATAPSADTDFDMQSPIGTSIGTMRFATGSLTATFIKAASTSVPLGQPTFIIAPANLNGITGAIGGSVKGTRP